MLLLVILTETYIAHRTYYARCMIQSSSYLFFSDCLPGLPDLFRMSVANGMGF